MYLKDKNDNNDLCRADVKILCVKELYYMDSDSLSENFLI